MHDGWTSLSVAAYNGHLDVMRCLVKDFGADVNQADQDGDTPLSIAADAGNLDVV
jgi:ankyrin repeat protein